MDIPNLTLDTAVVHAYWDQEETSNIVEKLLILATQGKVDLAVTARIRTDIPRPPLATRINTLPELRIAEVGAVARMDYWVLDRDMRGDDAFVAYEIEQR